MKKSLQDKTKSFTNVVAIFFEVLAPTFDNQVQVKSSQCGKAMGGEWRQLAELNRNRLQVEEA